MVSHLAHLAAAPWSGSSRTSAPHATRVTVVTLSEFGRRVGENGDHGIDHGYGNAMLLLGARRERRRRCAGGGPRCARTRSTRATSPCPRTTAASWPRCWQSRFGLSGGQLGTVFPGFTPETVGSMV